jgi:hypothetical protein
MRTITQFLKCTGIVCFMFTALLFSSCEDDSDEGTNNNNNSSLKGVWTRLPGPSGDRTDLAIGGIEGESSERVYMCEKQGSTAAGLYKGYIDGHYITWDAEYGLPDTYIEIVGGKLEFSYPDCSFCLVTDYERGSWGGDCGLLQNGGGGTTETTGQVMFWTQNDLGCGTITVNVAGNGGSITGYYSSGAPSCGAAYGANFTLPAGNYSFTASCSSYNWNGNVTVTAGGCFKMQLTQ